MYRKHFLEVGGGRVTSAGGGRAWLVQRERERELFMYALVSLCTCVIAYLCI